MTSPSTTIILGGGFGGLAVCASLRQLSKDEKIIVIDEQDQFVIGATKHYVALGEKSLKDIHYYIPKALADLNCEFMKAEVLEVNLKNAEIITSIGSVKGTNSNLVIALGANYDDSIIPGLKLDQFSHEYYTPAGAERLRPALNAVKPNQHIVILIPRSPFKCPPAPYEFAMLLRDHFKNVPKVKISVYTLENAPMMTAGPEAGAFMKDQLKTNGISFNGGKKTISVDTDMKKITFEDQSTVEYDLLIHIPPLVLPKPLKAAGLANASGFIPANPQTFRVEHPESKFKAIWAIGDCTTVSLPGRFKPDVPLVLPKAGTIAHGAGQVVAQQIAKGSSEPFSGEGWCYFETGHGGGFTANMKFYAMPNPTSRFDGPNEESVKEKQKWIDGIVNEFHLSSDL
jgi:sulfide:quinone oxidoreductase